MKRDRRIGFTLIELLVVIAIIAVLAAILFPVFMSAKNSAKLAACLNHGKELTTAILLYAQDNGNNMCGLNGINKSMRGYTPSPTADDDPSSGSLWKYYRSRNMLYCPADRERMHDTVSGRNLYSFTLNGYVTWRYEDHKYPGPAGKMYEWGPPLSMFPRSTKTVLLIEERTDLEASSVIDWCYIYRDVVTERHMGKGCITFLDGHVKAVKGGPATNWRTAAWPDGGPMFHDGSIWK